MTVRNEELFAHFKMGDSGMMNHTETMQVKSVGQVTLLIGYDRCIYAHRTSDGEVTKYTGWRTVDTSNTTDRHINAFSADRTVKARPQIINWADGLVQPNGAERIRELGK